MKFRIATKLKKYCDARLAVITEYPYFCRIVAVDYESYLFISIVLGQMKNIRVVRNYYTKCFDVYDKSDFERCEEVATQKRFLIYLFYNAMRNTSDQFYARQIQINYVSEHPEYLEAYNEIYHIREVADHES